MFDEKMHPVDQIRETMKQLYDMSLTTSSGGNLSMADGEGCVWMSPTTLDKGALKREEISRYTLDGALLSGKPGSVEWKINIAIHRARPDIKAVLHMHSPGVLCYASVSYTHLEPAGITYSMLKTAYLALEGEEIVGADLGYKGYDNITVDSNNEKVLYGSAYFTYSKDTIDDLGFYL